MKKKNQVERYHVQYISEIETEKKRAKGKFTSIERQEGCAYNKRVKGELQGHASNEEIEYSLRKRRKSW